MALTSLDMQNYLARYKSFKGVYAMDAIPLTLLSKPFGIIINLDPSWKSGSHWTAVYVSEYGNGVYFDSYGQPPPGNVKTFLERNCKNYGYEWNIAVFQGDLSIKCGYFCITFLKSCFTGLDFPFMKCKTNYNENIIKKIY